MINKINYKSITKYNTKELNNIIKEWFINIPYIKPYYAVNSLPNIKLIKYLSKSGFGFDCVSKGEIKSVLKYSSDIIYTNPTKSIFDIKYALNKNINFMVIDSIEEIQKISELNKNIYYIIRIQADELYSQIKFNKKFGASYNEVNDIIYYITSNKLKLYGFSFHVGTKCSNMKAYKNTIDIILNSYLIDCYKNNIYPNVIDIGGGFEKTIQLKELNDELNDIKETLNNNNIHLIAEPGRLISNSVLKLYCNIIAIREKNIDGIKTLLITINDSIYNTFQGKIFDGQTYNPIPLYEVNNRDLVRCIIYGQSCSSLDIICENILLPYPKLGDTLLFNNIGSYSLVSDNLS